MREIKFRCWDKDEEVMFKQADIGSIDFSYKQINIENDQYSYLESYDKDGSFEIMQYTGLKDKNGEEIYEGDILAPDKTCRGSNRYIVEWNDKHCCFTSIEGGIDNFIGDIDEEIQYSLLSNMKLNVCKIIGNMYENPELLKGEE